MGLITLTLTGCGFVLIGALEALTSSTHLRNGSPSSSLAHIMKTESKQRHKKSSSSTLTFLAVFAFSFSSIVDSLVSLSDASTSSDRVGSALQLQSFSVASLFLMYSILGLIRDLNDSVRFPSSILDLVLVFAFVEEFLLFYLQRKDPIGVENRYYDLLLLPISVCVVSTVMGFFRSSDVPKMGRGVGLILQGTWFLQMGFSFYSDFIAHGCSLVERSRGNYRIRCKGHPDYHRGRAIATLQFNCHLAFLVVLAVVFYSVLADRSGARCGGSRMYRPIGGEMGSFHGHPHFSLDSDGDGDDDEIGEEKHSGADIVMEAYVNGRGLYQ